MTRRPAHILNDHPIPMPPDGMITARGETIPYPDTITITFKDPGVFGIAPSGVFTSNIPMAVFCKGDTLVLTPKANKNADAYLVFVDLSRMKTYVVHVSITATAK
jgi:hypothetical protein